MGRDSACRSSRSNQSGEGTITHHAQGLYTGWESFLSSLICNNLPEICYNEFNNSSPSNSKFYNTAPCWPPVCQPHTCYNSIIGVPFFFIPSVIVDDFSYYIPIFAQTKWICKGRKLYLSRASYVFLKDIKIQLHKCHTSQIPRPYTWRLHLWFFFVFLLLKKKKNSC